MKLNEKGLLIVISGPSGVGKGTVRKALFERPGHNLEYSVSMTTRTPRNGETEGKEYYFVTKEQFEEAIKEGNMLEHAKFVNNYYGTPKDKAIEQLNTGKEVVLEIEVQGALQVKAKMPGAVFIFIAPPSWEALENRLTSRGTEPKEIIEERLLKARNELMVASSYDYIVINDEIENAVDKIIAIIRAEHARCDRALEGYYKLMEEK